MDICLKKYSFHKVQPLLKVVPEKIFLFFTLKLTNFSDQTLDKRCQLLS